MQSTLHLDHNPFPIRRTVFDFAGLLVLVLLLAVLTGGALWHFCFLNRIYYGVSVGGIPVGGMTRAAALQALEERLGPSPLAPGSLPYGGGVRGAAALRAWEEGLAQSPRAPVSLHYGGEHWPLPIAPASLRADLLT